MKKNSRGFKDFVGEEIIKVDTTCVNVVHFHTRSGKVISIDAEKSHHRIPVISVNDWNITK